MKVTGKPQPKVKWLRDGEEIHASEEYQIDNFEDGTSVLVINHVYPDDYGTISFEAYNPLGIAVTTSEFAVEGIVSITNIFNLSAFYDLNNPMFLKFSRLSNPFPFNPKNFFSHNISLSRTKQHFKYFKALGFISG